MIFDIRHILHILKMNYVPGSNKIPSFTKKGPGRKHKQGK